MSLVEPFIENWVKSSRKMGQMTLNKLRLCKLDIILVSWKVSLTWEQITECCWLMKHFNLRLLWWLHRRHRFISRPGCKRLRFACELCPPARPAEQSQRGTWWSSPSSLGGENLVQFQCREKLQLEGLSCHLVLKMCTTARAKTGGGPTTYLEDHNRM